MLRIVAALIAVLSMVMSAGLAVAAAGDHVENKFKTEFLEVNGEPFTEKDYEREIPVPHENEVKGKTEKIPDGKYLWLVVHPHGARGYWPQQAAIRPHPKTHKWSQTFWIGSEGGDHGKVFDVSLVLVNQDDHEGFVRYLEEGAKTGEYPERPLPSQAEPVDAFTVKKVRD